MQRISCCTVGLSEQLQNLYTYMNIKTSLVAYFFSFIPVRYLTCEHGFIIGGWLQENNIHLILILRINTNKAKTTQYSEGNLISA